MGRGGWWGLWWGVAAALAGAMLPYGSNAAGMPRRAHGTRGNHEFGVQGKCHFPALCSELLPGRNRAPSGSNLPPLPVPKQHACHAGSLRPTRRPHQPPLPTPLHPHLSRLLGLGLARFAGKRWSPHHRQGSPALSAAMVPPAGPPGALDEGVARQAIPFSAR